MKKILNFGLFISICAITTNIALADGMVFDPVDYPAPPSTSTPKTTTATPKTTPVAATKAKADTSATATGIVSKENDNFQNALFQLDSAQVEIRNSLLEYKSKYDDVNNQYMLIKEERKNLKKQVNDIERKIKDIDRTKEKIRKNMN